MDCFLRRCLSVFALIGLLGTATPAAAVDDDTEEPPGVTFSMTTGVFTPVVLDSGELFGAYLYVGPNAIIPVSKKFAVITGAGFEVAPSRGNYGAVGLVIGEYLATDWLGLDAIALLAQDTHPDLGTTAFASFGAGTSFLFDGGLTVSPMITYDINIHDLPSSISPSLFLSVPFP